LGRGLFHIFKTARLNLRYASLKTAMHFCFIRKMELLIAAVFIAAPFLCAQDPAAPNQDAQRKDLVVVKGMPPRTAPTEYQAHAQSGTFTIAAEFMGHAVPTPDATYTTEDMVVVEVAIFGPPDAHNKMSIGDFSLRINGKKQAQPSQPYELAFHSLKDPEWEPPKAAQKSKTSIGTGGGGGGQDDPNPAPVHMPIELRRAMEQRVQKATMAAGDRVLPQAALIFFDYRGKVEKITSLDLIYSGPAGSATLALQP
jgi:hypothetical protein